MKFIDQATIVVTSGAGGHGSRHFRREKHVPRGGPDGGDGGKGGDIVLVASNRARSLFDFHHRKHFAAEDGAMGGEKRSSGRAGEDLTLTVPPGTAVYEDISGTLLGDLTHDGARLVVAVGGNGGWGNCHFKSATRQAPDRANLGQPGRTLQLRLELRLLADVALVGPPNVGKSTLIRAISASKAEVADYPFTTIVPNLGVVRHRERTFTVADVPGLVQGAAEGAGLGHRFLKHVERCAALVFVLDPLAELPVVTQLSMLRKELAAFSADLARQPWIVALSKADLLGADADRIVDEFAATSGLRRERILAISGVTGSGVPDLLDLLLAMLPAPADPTLGNDYNPLGGTLGGKSKV